MTGGAPTFRDRFAMICVGRAGGGCVKGSRGAASGQETRFQHLTSNNIMALRSQ
jgi:hypothetical protein